MICRSTFAIWVCAITLAFSVHGAQSVDTLLQQAQRLLEGEHKDVPQARKLLLEIVRNARGEALVWADIYLGYIEDRANNRQSALGWYESALGVKGASSGSLDLARFGLKRPLVWIAISIPAYRRRPQDHRQYGLRIRQLTLRANALRD